MSVQSSLQVVGKKGLTLSECIVRSIVLFFRLLQMSSVMERDIRGEHIRETS